MDLSGRIFQSKDSNVKMEVRQHLLQLATFSTPQRLQNYVIIDTSFMLITNINNKSLI